jgi:hypothetical protein
MLRTVMEQKTSPNWTHEITCSVYKLIIGFRYINGLNMMMPSASYPFWKTDTFPDTGLGVYCGQVKMIRFSYCFSQMTSAFGEPARLEAFLSQPQSASDA